MFLQRDKMQVIFFGSDMDIIDEWKSRHSIEKSTTCTDIDSILNSVEDENNYIIITDYDSAASKLNTLMSSDSLPDKLIVLEKSPAIATGKLLVLRGVKAYGNSRMLKHHYNQMINTVLEGDIWTYPALTAVLVKSKEKSSLNPHSIELIEDRLSDKEEEVLYLILNGLTNDAIALGLNITTRTVKAHVSSIFSKLHVNDRVSLILLLK